ncbi:MAG: DUF2510 domain-containing protein [Actinomycetota bacterium]
MNQPLQPTAGWFPDPTGRFEVRYFNGRDWTADVADGGRRMVDPAGTSPPGASGRPTHSAPGRNRPATAGMILAIVAASLTWLPFIVVIGVLAAVVALALSIVGLRRSRADGSGRSTAVAGVSIALGALLLAVLGVVLSVLVYDELDAFRNPQPHDATITDCSLTGTTAVARGTLTNLGDRTGSYSVEVAFTRAGTDNVQRSPRVDVDNVAPGGAASFEIEATVGVDRIDCRIESVDGPLPFGIAF